MAQPTGHGHHRQANIAQTTYSQHGQGGGSGATTTYSQSSMHRTAHRTDGLHPLAANRGGTYQPKIHSTPKPPPSGYSQQGSGPRLFPLAKNN